VTAEPRSLGRPLDEEATRRILDAALRLLSERGFARTSIEAIATEAGVGKPAVYRRFRGKADVLAAAIATALPPMELEDLDDTRAEFAKLAHALPEDGAAYVGIVGQLLGEHARHPELVAAFRTHVLQPRRELAMAAIRRGQARGDLRDDLTAEELVDFWTGQFLARVWAGRSTDPAWRAGAFETWWKVAARMR
jgi:AcrR family transcriptional regulator